MATIAPPGTDGTQEWNEWIWRIGEFQDKLHNKLHYKERVKQRKNMGARVRKREEDIKAGKVKQALNKIPERDRGGDIYSMSIQDESGEARLITEEGTLAREAVKFFAEWMGLGRIRWYTHPMEDGTQWIHPPDSSKLMICYLNELL